MTTIYLIGSLRNPAIPGIGNALRENGFDVFDDWFAGGKIADDEWQAYETKRGRTYQQALTGFAARHVFTFDLYHLERADLVIMALPAGRSGHLEFGYARGRSKPGFILFDQEPERWDVMVQFANDIAFSLPELIKKLIPWAGFTWSDGATQPDFMTEIEGADDA